MTRRRIALVVGLVAALVGLAIAGTWASTTTYGRSSQAGAGMIGGYGPDGGMMSGHGMMRDGAGTMMGGYALPGNGVQVDSLDAADRRAQEFADRWGLRVGEVMRFSNGFYAELRTPDGNRATEVLIDPADGTVQLEYGPAMMWNTSYGMHDGAATPARVSAAEAAGIAQRWLDDQRPELRAAEPERFPGYYTMHTTRDGKVSGMMSVNAYTGAVWYHDWHGRFIAMSEE